MDPAGDYAPAWSRDGSQIAFHSLRHGTRDIFTVSADGSGLTRRTEGPPLSWTWTGRLTARRWCSRCSRGI
jgi:Tol biopolymer transport system component